MRCGPDDGAHRPVFPLFPAPDHATHAAVYGSSSCAGSALEPRGFRRLLPPFGKLVGDTLVAVDAGLVLVHPLLVAVAAARLPIVEVL